MFLKTAIRTNEEDTQIIGGNTKWYDKKGKKWVDVKNNQTFPFLSHKIGDSIKEESDNLFYWTRFNSFHCLVSN